MIDIFTPNTEQLKRGTAVNLAIRFGMQTAKPFKISEQISKNGNPSFSELKELEGSSWLTSLAIRFGEKEVIFEECIISLNQEKNIITTSLQGKNGTVKEYISNGDYNITINAALSNYKEMEDSYEASLEYPKEKIEALQEILNLPETLEVQSDFLTMFNIKSAVIKSFDLQQETHSNRQSINIQMLSDESYEIKLKEENYAKTM